MRGVGRSSLDPIAEHLPYACIRREYRWLQFLQILDNGVRVLEIVADDARLKREVKAKNALHDLTHWQQCKPLIIRAHRQLRPRIGDKAHCFTMAQRLQTAIP